MLRKYFKNQSSKSAFTLIELSIVIAIIGILIAGAANFSTTALKNAKIKVTQQRLEAIEEALANFVYTNRRLPCPARLGIASTDTNYGLETTNLGVCSDAGGVFVSTNSTEFYMDAIVFDDLKAAYGAIPFRTLGLNSDFGEDAFGNKISYVVSQVATKKSNPDPTGADPLVGRGLDTILLDLAPTAGDGDRKSLSLKITETSSGSSVVVNGLAAYVVISHGPNGIGAYNAKSTTQNSISGATTDEGLNYYRADFGRSFVTKSNNANFDDILRYNDIENILRKSGIAETRSCLNLTSNFRLNSVAEVGSYDSVISPNNEINFQTVGYGQLGSSIQSCAAGTHESKYSNDTTRAYRRCGKNGIWESTIEFPCLPI